jgi:membrane protein implicated in regulation of membrane protease activity
VTLTQPWLVLLVTLIGAPGFALLLYFFVPLLEAAKRLSKWIADPSWWFRDIVVAALVAGAVLYGQKVIDDIRSTRDREISRVQTSQSERLENLRFVLDRSSPGYRVRPFAGFDLQGMNLSGLRLSGADLLRADLSGTDLTTTSLTTADAESVLSALNVAPGTASVSAVHTVLAGANLCKANLTGASLVGADLSLANLSGADLSFAILARVDLSGADLTGARLNDVKFDLIGVTPHPGGIYYDNSTKWPEAFQPPPIVESFRQVDSSPRAQAMRQGLVRPQCRQ